MEKQEGQSGMMRKRRTTRKLNRNIGRLRQVDAQKIEDSGLTGRLWRGFSRRCLTGAEGEVGHHHGP